jgi:hypothetical protein
MIGRTIGIVLCLGMLAQREIIPDYEKWQALQGTQLGAF